jgi:hypothetical protein
MSSFFGFETALPTLDSDQLTGLEENTGGPKDETEEEDLEKKLKDLSFDSEGFGVYDDEQNLDLSKLIETGDDHNDETFGNDVDIGELMCSCNF